MGISGNQFVAIILSNRPSLGERYFGVWVSRCSYVKIKPFALKRFFRLSMVRTPNLRRAARSWGLEMPSQRSSNKFIRRRSLARKTSNRNLNLRANNKVCWNTTSQLSADNAAGSKGRDAPVMARKEHSIGWASFVDLEQRSEVRVRISDVGFAFHSL